MALDNFRKINITLNKANQHVLEPQIAKVGDVNGRELVVQLIDGGVIKDQSGVVLKLNWQHANGNQGSETFKALDAKQGLFSVYYPEKMLYRGTVKANISVNDGGNITNSLNFQIAVKGDVFDGSAVEVDGLLFTLKDLKDQIDERDGNLVDLENRQTSVESQFNSLQQEIMDKDITSAPEIIAARGDELTLSDRLDKDQQEVEAKLAQKVEKNIVSEIPSNLTIYPEGTILMVSRNYVDNLYWYDDFKVLDSEKWYVWESEEGMVKLDGGLKMDSGNLQTAFAFNRKGFRKDISGVFSLRVTRNMNGTHNILEIYDTNMSEDNMSIFNKVQIVFTGELSERAQLRVFSKDNKEYSWDDTSREWMPGKVIMTNFPFSLTDIVKLETIVDVEKDSLSFIITNESQEIVEKTNAFPLSNVRGLNQCYPHMTDTSTSAAGRFTWINVSYSRLGGK